MFNHNDKEERSQPPYKAVTIAQCGSTSVRRGYSRDIAKSSYSLVSPPIVRIHLTSELLCFTLYKQTKLSR